jgi:prophage maintenance system killer protein
MSDNLPTPAEIVAMHEEIEEAYDLKYKGVRIAAPKLTLREDVVEPAAEHDDPWHRAAVLLFGIPSAHVFEDANKRTAWAVTTEYLHEQGLEVDLPQDDKTIERIVRRGGLFDTEELAEWLETGEIDESKLPER